MSEKVARLGIERKAGQMYFLRGNEVWSAPMGGGDAKKAERIAVGEFECEDGWLYFLDKDGDISRAERATRTRSVIPKQDLGRTSTSRETIELLKQRGWSAESIDRIQPSLRLRMLPAASEAAIGVSRFGGLPDLPEGIAWPNWQGVSRPDFVTSRGHRVPRSIPPTVLSFIGQINLAELPLDDSVPLPRRGLLSFFYDAEHQPWGFDPTDRGSTSVLYFEDATKLVPACKPEQLAELNLFPPRLVRAAWEATLPQDPPSEFSRDPDAYYAVVDEIVPGSIQHRMLGHPQPVQGDEMELECQLVTNGIYCGDSSGYRDPRVTSLRAGVDDWILLLQVDSDDSLGWCWGDAGRVYFWIKKQDVAAHRFDRVWTILQCC